ncbi:MAG TPA: hypothetical protein VM943_03110, partial [Pyrinomonadaceae bacterium]|nr:hypothetical protein [Pyrinomonadaceae bacterium]
GHDQKQHLELTRDIAIRFNRDFGEVFRVPDPYIPKVGALISALDDPTKKMSKSDENANGAIMLTDDADRIRRKFKSAVTDSGTEILFDNSRPAITNLLSIFQLLTEKTPDEVEAHFAGKGYAQLKSDVAEATIEFLKPFQGRVAEISDEELQRILSDGRDRAAEIASATMREAKMRMGLEGA